MRPWLLAMLLAGCADDRTTDETSRGLALDERRALLERHVAFRRTYRTLDFAIAVHDNRGGRVPGPSDWRIELVATVPRAELAQWTGGMRACAEDTAWIRGVPVEIALPARFATYCDGGRSLAVDASPTGEDVVIAYRNATR